MISEACLTLRPGTGDGTSTVKLLLNAIGNNEFTLQVRAPGYHCTDYDFTVIRTQSEEELINGLKRQARNVTYARGITSPAAYAGRVLRVSGTANGLAYAGGSPALF